MKKEIIFRLTRIVCVLLFLFIAFFLKNNTVMSYNHDMNIYKELMNNLQISQIENENDNKVLSVSDKLSYDLKVTNSSNISKTFVINIEENSDNTIDYKYINFEIICDGEVLKTGKINNNNLYIGKISSNTTKVYKVNLWLDDVDNDLIANKKFSSKIIIM